MLPGEDLKGSREGTFERLRKEWNTPPLGLLSAALPDGWAGEAVDAAAAKAVRPPDLLRETSRLGSATGISEA